MCFYFENDKNDFDKNDKVYLNLSSILCVLILSFSCVL